MCVCVCVCVCVSETGWVGGGGMVGACVREREGGEACLVTLWKRIE